MSYTRNTKESSPFVTKNDHDQGRGETWAAYAGGRQGRGKYPKDVRGRQTVGGRGGEGSINKVGKVA